MSEAVKVEEGLYTRAKTLIVLVLGLRLRGCVARDDSLIFIAHSSATSDTRFAVDLSIHLT